MKHPRLLPLFLATSFLAAYVSLYYAAAFSVLPSGPGGPVRRSIFFEVYLFRPDDLVREWLGSPPDPAILDRAAVVVVAGAIFAWAGSLGWLANRLIGADRGLTRLERFVFAAGVGLNLVSTYVLAIGLIGWLDRAIAFFLPAVLTFAGAGWLWWRNHREPVWHVAERRASPVRKQWLWLIVPFVAVIWLGGMLPPIEFDVREYHLQVPKEFYQQGRITFLPHNVYGNMAMGTEMLSLLAMVVADDWWLGALAGKTLTASFAPLAALALFAAGRRLVSTTAGFVAAAAFISVPWIAQVSMLGLVEGAVACYLFLALYAFLLYATPGQAMPVAERGPASDHHTMREHAALADRSRLVLAGYLVGAAVAAKYPAALFVAVPFTAATIWSQVRRRWQVAWTSMALFLLAMAIGCGLWFAKNWALTGNPTYPLLYDLFGGETRTAEKDAQWMRAHQPHVFSLAQLAEDLMRVGLTSPWLSPVLLPLAALAVLNGRHRRMAMVLAAYFAYVIAVWWLFTHRIDRFWIPAIPVLALLAGIGAEWTESKPWRVVLLAALVLGAVGNFLAVASPVIADNRFFAPLARLREDPLRVDPWTRYFNNHAPDGCILMVGEAQVFDFRPRVVYDTCFDSSQFERLVKNRSPEEIRKSLLSMGITHVYVHWGEIARYRATYGYTEFVRPEVFDGLVAQGVLEPLPEIGGHPGRAYRVSVERSSLPPALLLPGTLP